MVGVVVGEPDAVTAAFGEVEAVAPPPQAAAIATSITAATGSAKAMSRLPFANPLVHKSMSDSLRCERWDIDAISSPQPGMGASIG